ncbi:MAG TPA: SDR family NAD(P)-dependent oxidoreductase [Xanthobacteraceae bacterium]
MRLDGKAILITGGARGIGAATAIVMAELGADIGLVDIDERVEETRRAVQALGRRASAALCDIADFERVENSVAAIERDIGPLHGLVNNAGIVDNIAPLQAMASAAWRRELEVNLTGPFNMIRAVIPGMAERGWGRIVNVSSAAARDGLRNQAGYSASKAGLLGLTHNVTIEYGARGITCNAVLPGLIGTEKVRSMPAAILDQAIGLSPARRLGEPREVAYLIAFLCSDLAGFINGAEILIDGGAAMNAVSFSTRKVKEIGAPDRSAQG